VCDRTISRPERVSRVPAIIPHTLPELRSVCLIRLRRACSGLLLLLVVLGCEQAPDLRTVEGTITYAGKPLDHGMVMFQPSTGRPVGAGIQPDGRYSISLPPGDYDVIVNAPPKLPEGFKEGDPLPPPDPNPVPAKYSRKETSGLSAKVAAGSAPQTVDFVLE
jgi:hypothetical protein